jgi:hypothetical protein
MSILPISQDYTAKDFASLRERTFNLIRSVFPDWTVDAAANFGNMLVESFCFCGDVMTYYQDQQAGESRWATVQLRKNAIALARLIGYRLSPAAAASADVLLTLTNAAALTGTVSAPPGTPVVVRTNEVTAPVRGELDAPVTFNVTGGETAKTFTWRHQITQPAVSVPSTNRPNQSIWLPFTPFLDTWTETTVSTEVVSSTVDGAFSRVENFIDSGATSLHYRLQLDQNDAAQVIFGDGRNGKIPTGTITVTYKTGGGSAGLVEQGGLVVLETTLYDTAGTRAYCTATNAAAAVGGVPREEVSAARIHAPDSLRTLSRTVAREDFEINALRVPGVGRAVMLTSNEQTGIAENSGKLFIIPTTGGVASSALLADVEYMIAVGYPSTVTFRLEVLSAPRRTINIDVSVWLRPNTTPSVAKAAIAAALEDYFDPMLASGAPNPNIDFGWNYKDADGNPAGEIAWSDVFDVIRDVATVRKVDQGMLLNGAVNSVSIANWEFPALGTLVVRDGNTGNAL